MSNDDQKKEERIKLKIRDEQPEDNAQSPSNNGSLSNSNGQQGINLQGVDPKIIQNLTPSLGGDTNVPEIQKASSVENADQKPAQADDQDKKQTKPEEQNKVLIQPPARPTQEASHGIFYDFNIGMRVSVPKPLEGEGWRIRFMDKDTEVSLLDQPCFDLGFAATSKHHFLNGRITVFKIAKDGKQEEVFNHEYNAKGKDVLVVLPVGSLGDSLGWMPYAEKLREKHDCKLTVALGKVLIPLFETTYPEVTFVDAEEFLKEGVPNNFYASYYIGLFFTDDQNHWQPHDFRQVGLHRTAGYILGVDPTEVPPRLAVEDDTRPIEEPYVVIATQASTQCKYWNNPYGWHKVIEFLKSVGYRVICIDKEQVYGRDLVWNHIPNGAEDQTGARPLAERVRWLKHAEFFVGLSSGLAWLAWGAGIPTVIISGFTHPSTEFDTPYRVFSTHVCNSCWNDVRHLFDHQNFLYCPKHRDTPRQFECTRGISHQHVIKTIQSIPGCRKEPVVTETTDKK